MNRIERGLFVFAGIVLAAMLTVHLLFARSQVSRGPDFDEAEYMHGSWLLSQGKHMYRDFAEDHSPFLQAILRAVQPKRTTADYPRFDVLRFLVRARAMIVGFGILAVASAALLAFRIVRRPSTPAMVAAALAGSRWTWHPALSDLRNHPPTLFLFWAGPLLLL